MIKRRLIKVAEIFEEVNATRQSDGLGAVLARAVTVIREIFFLKTSTLFFVRSLDRPPEDVATDHDTVVRELQVQDLALLEAVVERSDFEWYKSLFRRGRTCLVALKDKQLAAYMWLTSAVDPHLERVYVPLAPGDMYVVEIKTMPAFQRQGFQKMLLKHAIAWAKEQGGSRLVSMTGVDNETSLSLHNKLGYRQVSCITRTKVLILLHVRYDPNPFGKAGNVWMLY